MRLKSVIGVGVVVIVVIVAARVALRSGRESESEIDLPVAEELTEPSSPSGQFIQEIPSTPEPVPEATGVADDADPEVAETVTITMSESGFSPASVTVKPGTRVQFMNNGQALHWPASAVHPTHNVLPGFDSKGGLATGETYAFTFNKVGVWTCHDHLLPNLTCVVTVSE